VFSNALRSFHDTDSSKIRETLYTGIDLIADHHRNHAETLLEAKKKALMEATREKGLTPSDEDTFSDEDTIREGLGKKYSDSIRMADISLTLKKDAESLFFRNEIYSEENVLARINANSGVPPHGNAPPIVSKVRALRRYTDIEGIQSFARAMDTTPEKISQEFDGFIKNNLILVGDTEKMDTLDKLLEMKSKNPNASVEEGCKVVINLLLQRGWKAHKIRPYFVRGTLKDSGLYSSKEIEDYSFTRNIAELLVHFATLRKTSEEPRGSPQN
jgi:hypothetical protein